MNKIFFLLLLSVMSKSAIAGAAMSIAYGCGGDSTCTALKIGGLFIMTAIILALYYAVGFVYDWLFKEQIERKKLFNNVANAGYLAFQNGLALEDNPHLPDSESYDFWSKGYQIAKRRREEAKL